MLFEAIVLSDVVKLVSMDDNCPLHLYLGLTSDGDVTSKRALLVNVVMASLGVLKPRSMFLQYCGSSLCWFLQAGSVSYFERWSATFGRHAQSECLPSSRVPEKRKVTVASKFASSRLALLCGQVDPSLVW